MSDVYIPSVSLHQQDGGMSVQAFADKEGISKHQVLSMAKRGLVMGAQQDSRSKKWWIYPPAKLLQQPRSYTKRQGGSPELAPHSQISAVAAAAQQKQAEGSAADFGQHVPQVEAEGMRPPASPVLTLEDSALPVAARSLRARPPASCGKPKIYTEARSVCQALHEAAVRQYREGIHYLRLDAHELAQLYAALNNDRSRVRKLVGRGILPVGLLRASDTVWQKMQAMCREGRLL